MAELQDLYKGRSEDAIFYCIIWECVLKAVIVRVGEKPTHKSKGMEMVTESCMRVSNDRYEA